MDATCSANTSELQAAPCSSLDLFELGGKIKKSINGEWTSEQGHCISRRESHPQRPGSGSAPARARSLRRFPLVASAGEKRPYCQGEDRPHAKVASHHSSPLDIAMP